ncbi:MAG: putative sulfate exporter family transporter [Syntrophus sp. (in: bacteria)]|nr:putative sulfate exporter family transporter [Syntrophus sp. (in: bacteria)]
MAEKQGIDWSSLWKKDDWMAVWIGFLIIILTLIGLKLTNVSFKWTTDGEFATFAEEQIPGVEKLAKDAGSKGEQPLQEQLLALKTALESKDRKAVSGSIKKVDEVGKTAKDEGLKKKVNPLMRSIRGQTGSTIEKVFSGENFIAAFWVLIFFWIIAAIGAALMGFPVGKFIAGFPIIFIIAFIAQFLAGNYSILYYGLEYVIWCLLIGLVISNTVGTPKWLLAAVRTEYFIKTGLVILGSGILFGEIIKAGGYGIVQGLLVVGVVWYFCYWVCRKFKVDEEFSAILASGVSICGVSAAIATSGAVKGDPKKLSYVTSIILVCAVPMMVVMPWIIKATGMDHMVAGAWMGGTLDTSGSVVAAGSLVSETAMKVGVIVKMSQNVLIGFAAFILAIVWTFKKAVPGEKPGAAEIWYRFPKFVLGFIIASLIFSFILDAKTVDAVKGQLGSMRTWWFAMAFTCIGLETRFADLFKMEGGRPAIAFLIAQTFNIFWTLLLSWLIFGGVLFQAPKF